MKKVEKTTLISTYSFKTLFLVAIMLMSSLVSFAQDKKEKTRKKFQYELLNDGTTVLGAYVFVKTKSGMVGVPNIDILLIAEDDSTKVTLGTVATNSEGWAYLNIAKGYKLPINEDGVTKFSFKFNGNDKLLGVKETLKIIQASMLLKLDKTDDKNEVTVTVKNSNGGAVKKVKVALSIKRLYSLLPIDVVKTNSKGQAIFEVPTDIPGNRDGDIEIVAQIVRDRKYGNITKTEVVNWGIKNTYKVTEEEKSLWTESAPLWMQFSMLVLFAMVFGLLGMAMFNVYKMSRDE
ncbi:MAG: Ig-like domain-containing protein [Flavobacteriales bacterium]|nr:Ig-like domain-containing protein [Flavobacteriales bacterium]